MANRMVLNETSYFGWNARENLVSEIKKRKFKRILVVSDENLVNNKDLLEMISYDKDNFIYTDNPDLILSEFKKWSGDLPIMLIEKDYTKEYLASLNNKMELVYPYLEVEYNYDVFNTIMNKYQIEASNYLVDIIYEAIILESNNEKVNNE